MTSIRKASSVPVLLLGFRRPACTRQVIAALRTAQIENVVFACDGPRKGASCEEQNAVREVRNLAFEFDWSCRLSTHFHESNRGCKKHVSESITGFLDRYGEGIILEDDCVPSQDFFRFANELLHRWRDDPRVGSIAGSLLTKHRPESSTPYRFSNFTSSWGWATWRRAWIDRDIDFDSWNIDRQSLIKRFSSVLGPRAEAKRWHDAFDSVRAETLDSWATGWFYSNLLHGRLTAVPNVNLVSNIGFGEGATHTRGGSHFARRLENTPNLVAHPNDVRADHSLDEAMRQEIFPPLSVTAYWKAKLRKRVAQLRNTLSDLVRSRK